jgi:hypothetical protein
MSEDLIGCCGAFCGSCRGCPGCTAGYETGDREITKARCRIKICCIGKLGSNRTCADCPDFARCDILQGFYGKNGYKYKKYKESLEFIRTNGRTAFLKIAKKWNRAYGRLI